MSDLAQIDAFIQQFVGNPFDVAVTAERSRFARNLQPDALGRWLRVLDEANRIASVDGLLLAWGHMQACDPRRSAAQVLLRSEVSERVWSRTTVERGERLRQVVLAAGRAYFALERVSGNSSAMRKVRQRAWEACFGSDLGVSLLAAPLLRAQNVLIRGPSGSGKELIAQAVCAASYAHEHSASVSINVAALSPTLLESELFGHEKGAYTGATKARQGLLREAHEHALFLDEVGDMPLDTQVKLLRVMEEKKVRPVQGQKSFPADVRFVAATHRDLEQGIQEGRFRADLYHRLAGFVIRLPSLSERREDIEGIVREHFARLFTEMPWHAENFTTVVLTRLGEPDARAYPWPGNVRELLRTAERIALGQEVAFAHLQNRFTDTLEEQLPKGVHDATWTRAEVCNWYEGRVLARLKGNKSAAARVLAIDRNTLGNRVRSSKRVPRGAGRST